MNIICKWRESARAEKKRIYTVNKYSELCVCFGGWMFFRHFSFVFNSYTSFPVEGTHDLDARTPTKERERAAVCFVVVLDSFE